MEEAHNTCQGSNMWQKRRGGVSYEREGASLEEGCHMGGELECGAYGIVMWRPRKGAPHI
jgi:hypothetical protein